MVDFSYESQYNHSVPIVGIKRNHHISTTLQRTATVSESIARHPCNKNVLVIRGSMQWQNALRNGQMDKKIIFYTDLLMNSFK